MSSGFSYSSSSPYESPMLNGERLGRWARRDSATSSVPMPPDYASYNSYPTSSQPINIPSRPRRSSNNFGSPSPNYVGGLANSSLSPLMQAYRSNSSPKATYTSSGEMLQFSMDDVDPPSRSRKTSSSSASRRNSSAYPAYTSPTQGASNPYATMSSQFSNALPTNMPRNLFSKPFTASSSTSSSGASLWSAEIAPSSQSSFTGSGSAYMYPSAGSSSSSSRSRRNSFSATTSQGTTSPTIDFSNYGKPKAKTPNLFSASKAASSSRTKSAFSAGSTLPPLNTQTGFPAFRGPELRIKDLKGAAAGKSRRRPSFTLGGPADEDGYSSGTSSASVTPRGRSYLPSN